MRLPEPISSELWRVTRHPVSRAFGAILLTLMVVLLVFRGASHSRDVQAALREAKIEHQQMMSSVPENDADRDIPVMAFYKEPRYFWAFDGRVDVQAAAMIGIVLAFMWGVILSGREWMIGTNLQVFTWEPRRARLLLARSLAAGGVAAIVSAIVIALLLVGTLAIAATRGSFVSVNTDMISTVLRIALRGVLGAASFAAMGSAFADLIRSLVVPIATMSAYLILGEPAIRAAFPSAAHLVLSNQTLEWVRGRLVEERSFAIDCRLELCPGALYTATSIGPGLFVVGIAMVLFVLLWMTADRWDVTNS